MFFIKGVEKATFKHFMGPSEVRVLPVRRCRRAAWQTLVATINGVNLLLSHSVTFLPEGVDLGL
jgi:hypothetical protein